jgi:hypothetical protein
MSVFFQTWPEYFKKAIITLQIMKLKLKTLNQNCTLSNSTMQLSKTIFLDSTILVEEKWLRIEGGRKSGKKTVAKKNRFIIRGNVGRGCMVPGRSQSTSLRRWRAIQADA